MSGLNGKGDKRRPTDEKRFGTNYERIFGLKSNKQFISKWQTDEKTTAEQDQMQVDHPKPTKLR